MRLHLPSLILGGALVSSLAVSGWVVAAQGPCPTGETCYKGHVLAFNPADGPVQALTVKTTSLTTETLDGTATAGTASLVIFAFKDGQYVQWGDPLPDYAKTGVLSTADAKDTFGLAELGQ